MKKGLSILLVAAALFGFYGGAVNLNDVLACKDYWEEAGAKSTADMNKLEDGLNQLKENEQAYLDGKDQLAEGEKTLAEGEATLADGEAQYAKGLKDYAEAPGKLADARKQIADGEAALADGQDSINGLTKLINGIKTIRKGYNNDWKSGYETLKNGRSDLTKGIAAAADNSLTPLAAFLQSSPQNAKVYLDAVNGIAKDDGKQTAAAYNTFVGNTNILAKMLPIIQDAVKTADQGANQLLAALNARKDSNLQFVGVIDAQKDNMKTFAAFITDPDQKAAFVGAIDKLSAGYQQYKEAIQTNTESTVKQQTQAYLQSEEGQNAVAQYVAAGMSEEKAIEAVGAAYAEKATPTIQEAVTQQVAASAQGNTDITNAIPSIVGAMQNIAAGLDSVNEQVNGKDSAINKTLLPGLKKFNAGTAADEDGKTAVEKLTEGQDTISGGVATVASAVLGNSTLKAGVKKNFGSKAIALLKAYKSSNGPLSSKVSDFGKFAAQMDSNPGIDSFLKKAQNLLAKTRAEGLKTLAAGKKKLADGKAQYAQGLQDYAEAPGKLADAEKQLEDGRQALEDGRQQLADGRAKLAEYEDGEQQVRDGLATLTGTEADLDLESILDRLGGDDDFDNGDEHLDIDEGLAAVDVGRGYQAEDGVLITDEIMARAVGTGALLGAGALAVLAAILSFLKKNKGAGVFAILAAAAGAFGAFYGTNAGTYFSDIAGSTAGNAAWVAAGILGAVALVHSIVHFTSKNA